MFQARSEWRRIRLIFDHAEGPLIRFAHFFSWVLCSNYHNCCAKHARLYGCCRDESAVPGDGDSCTKTQLDAGWMAGPAQGDGGEEEEGRPRIRSNPQPVTHSRAATQPLLPAGQDRALLSNQLPPRVYVMALFSFLISSTIPVL